MSFTSKLVKKVVDVLKEKYAESELTVVEGKGKFSRARALDAGARSLPEHSLLFFCDVDVTLSSGFLNRCRLNTIRGSRVFFPMLFTQYDPDLVKLAERVGLVEENDVIHRERGHWFRHSFGMVCVYNSDYRSIGGFDLNIHGWGGEDVDLAERFVSSLDVFRATEPQLLHRWHEKQCRKDLTAKQLEMCRGSQSETIGSKRQLALFQLNITKL